MTVHKPEAPVGVPFTDVQVVVSRERCTPVVVALGSNVGDSAETLHDAAVALYGLLDVTAVSRVVETDPVGGPEQPAYLNAVVTGTTHLAPSTLLARLHDIEREHGRTREVRWGPRTLDLDLIDYGRLELHDVDVHRADELAGRGWSVAWTSSCSCGARSPGAYRTAGEARRSLEETAPV